MQGMVMSKTILNADVLKEDSSAPERAISPRLEKEGAGWHGEDNVIVFHDGMHDPDDRA